MQPISLDRGGPSRGGPAGVARSAPARPARGLALLLALVALACGESGTPPSPAEGPHVLLVTFDTTRADALGAYGYERDTSPHLDALAREATLYTRAYSTSSWTLPAHASLFTGRVVSSHGARYDPEGPLLLTDAIDAPNEGWRKYRVRGLGEDLPTLAGILNEAGYATGAVVAGPWMKSVFGLDAGFEDYDERGIEEWRGRLAADVSDRAIEWLEARRGRNFLLFLNYYDPHGPYRPPEGHARAFLPEDARIGEEAAPHVARALYDAEIRYADLHFGRVLERLRELGLYRDTWVVVTSDHGELFGEHGLRGHGKRLYEPEIRVPLLVKPPGGAAAARSDALVDLTDLAPTLLEALGLPVPDEVQGRALDPEARERRPVLAELYPLSLGQGERGDFLAWIDGRHKLMWNTKGNHRLYDLAEDPSEGRNLVSFDPERLESMERKLLAYVDRVRETRPEGEGARAVDPETREALESLGYLPEEEGDAPRTPSGGGP